MNQKEWDTLFLRLSKSKFRSKFSLSQAEKEYCRKKGYATIRQHAIDFVTTRLAPPVISNDGHQTPWRGHPVFVAQHATATCCRKCLSKWHHIPHGTPLTKEQIEKIVAILLEWIKRQLER